MMSNNIDTSYKKRKQEVYKLLGNKCSNPYCVSPIGIINGELTLIFKFSRLRVLNYYKHFNRALIFPEEYMLMCSNCMKLNLEEIKEDINHETKHILVQLEYMKWLIEECNCIFVELEHSISNPVLHKLKCGSGYILDVYGEDKNGLIYFVEIGSINELKKKVLEKCAKDSEGKIEFIYVPLD